MTVRYIRVNPIADLFTPAVRAYGNIAIIGEVTPPETPPDDLADANEPIAFTDPGEALRRAPGHLGKAIALAFGQSPGPTLIYGVRTATATATGPDWDAALGVVSGLDVQLVVLANTPLDATTGAATNGAIAKLVNHVTTVSETGRDGKERMGVAMLAKGATNPDTIVTGTLAHERMVYIAHKSEQDAAAAVAGVIAGYEPHISLLLKPVNITSEPFTPTEILAINGSETFKSGPAGKGVNWLTDSVLIPGRGLYMGEGYTGKPDDKKYIDIVRTVDHVSFLLKAQLIKTIGALRISRSGLRALTAQMEAVLEPLVRSEVIERYDIVMPILTLLDKDPATLTQAESKQIDNAQAQRVVEVLVAVDYAGAIHRLAITLKFE
jgi:hypothetical protein